MKSPQTRRPDCKYTKKAQPIYLPQLANDTYMKYYSKSKESRILGKARKY
jgi:hypothetical protein